MFDLNWSDPQTRWLVVTNWTLFAVCAVCIGIVLYGVVVQLLQRHRRHSDAHSMAMPELGMTMADGGTPVFKRNPNKKR